MSSPEKLRETGSASNEPSPENLTPAERISLQRREVLARLGKGAAYAAPATLALLTLEAKACSVSC